jgi:hypothetical protein
MREAGWYWIKKYPFSTEHEAAYFIDGRWMVVGEVISYRDDKLAEIDERRIVRQG